ncbi:MAG TPA: LysM peptidoglycan-binding domain-containing protein [bacterium]|nr:LysM peptidoglycan-binding domain-containing protein [bacterium]
MKKKLQAVVALMLFAGLAFNSGCSNNKRIEGADAPNQPAATPVPVVASGSYTVERGDTLWAISGKSKVYGDPFAWPLLFKANRDTIQDPDIIEVKQVLKVDKSFSDTEKSHARSLASKTPKYVRHSQPRTTLPLNYF